MQLFFAPFACSLASHVAMREVGLDLDLQQVSLTTKTTGDGKDFATIAPKGKVPVLRLDDGTVLTEGPAVLQFIADQRPETGLAPRAGTRERYEMQEWLNYIATEIHKQIFWTIFSPDTPEEAKRFARTLITKRFDFLNNRLKHRDYLVGDRFTVADAYLLWALFLCRNAQMFFDSWPPLTQYFERMMQRPSVRAAIAQEKELVQAERKAQ